MKNFLSAVACVTISMCVVGCVQRIENKAADMNGRIQYFKDVRTGFCFAITDPSSQRATMATVPCTPEVEGLIGK